MQSPIKFDPPGVGAVGLTLVSFVKLTDKTIFGNFLRWLHLGSILDFILNWYPFLSALFVTIIIVRWIKNIYGLIIVYLMSLAFFYFLLGSVGIA